MYINFDKITMMNMDGFEAFTFLFVIFAHLYSEDTLSQLNKIVNIQDIKCIIAKYISFTCNRNFTVFYQALRKTRIE